MSKFEAMLACYRSGQMNARQMQEHMREDPGFAAWLNKKLCK